MENIKENVKITYKDAGVDVSKTDTIKAEMSNILETKDKRVMNRLGAFASLYDIRFPEMRNPVLVLKAEEPGSKQKLAFTYGYVESVCHDMINHLVNDIIVMGAKPLAVLDTIVTGKSDEKVISLLVKGMAEACRNNDCTLVGGETSIQPGIMNEGMCVLTSSIAGIADREQIIDGSAIREEDVILAIASNGIHTNGYSLIRILMEQYPDIIEEKIDGRSFIDTIMEPHRAYYPAIKKLQDNKVSITGMAHITGGGMEGNICRIMPEGLCAQINLALVKPHPIFSLIKSYAKNDEKEMLDTFNCGVGLVIVCRKESAEAVIQTVSASYDCYQIGSVIRGEKKVSFLHSVNW